MEAMGFPLSNQFARLGCQDPASAARCAIVGAETVKYKTIRILPGVAFTYFTSSASAASPSRDGIGALSAGERLD
jgi:hypothetical protein